MQFKEFIDEVPGIAITVARLGIAERIAQNVRRDESVIAELGCFLVADVLDGVVLRRFNKDTPIRRAADGIVDQLSVARTMLEVSKKNNAARPYIGLIATRLLSIGVINAAHYAKTGEVTKGNRYQKTTFIAAAGFGLAAATGDKRLTHVAGGAVSAISIATLPPHFRNFGVRSTGSIREL